MRYILARYKKFNSIWHFTDKSNLELIKEHKGLLSLGEAEMRGIEIPAPGGNDGSRKADRRKGLHEYVHLAFVKEHPMLFRARQEGRITEPVWLRIESTVILEEGVRFCSDVSNKSGVDILDSNQAEQQIDFEVLFTRKDWKDSNIQARRKPALKSEILVPRFIPIDKISGFEDG